MSSLPYGQVTDEIPGFDKTSFGYYFERADREVRPERWMDEARLGISIARSSWERLAAAVITDTEELAEAGRKLEGWTEDALEQRFSEWLQKRFFGSEKNRFAHKTARALGISTIGYVYHVDEEGNILTDDSTGDPLIIRPEEGRDISDERGEWREGAIEIGEQTVREYSASLEALFPELVTYIPAARREHYESILTETMGTSIRQYAAETGYLIAREERLLTARRTSDVLSLRKKSEEEAAAAIVSRLIHETESSCAEGIQSIEARIEAAAAGTGDLALFGEEWLEAYREQFERGLKAWEEAEERFFLRRIEWEQEAGKTYLEGEAAWSSAYNEILKERQRWESKAKSLFESGEAVFKQASQNVEEAIGAAKAEFVRDAGLRRQAGSERAKAWVDTYVTTGSVAAGCRETVQFWYSKYKSQEAPSLDSGEYTAWIENEIHGFWVDMVSAYQNGTVYKTAVMQVEKSGVEANKTICCGRRSTIKTRVIAQRVSHKRLIYTGE
ncbi:MAG: hypothetical protein LBR47_00805 [Spirochaetaceae bacterium]|nr:hypothetical protein [Spirochaetaceae bacterium]